MLAQLRFSSPFSRAYLESPQLLQDALDRIHIGPFQADGRLTPTLAPGDFALDPVLILLYAGRDDPLSLDSCIHAHYPRLSPHIVAFDTLRPPQPLGQDLLADQPYGHLSSSTRWACQACMWWPQLPDVVHLEMVPQAQRTTSSARQIRRVGFGAGGFATYGTT